MNQFVFFNFIFRQPRKKIMTTILDNIGNTPLGIYELLTINSLNFAKSLTIYLFHSLPVQLNSIPKSYGLKCEIRKYLYFRSIYKFSLIVKSQNTKQLRNANFLTLVEALRIVLD